MEFKTKYDLGQLVYLYTDTDQIERMVIACECRFNGFILYNLAFGASSSWHYEQEISATKNINKAMGIS